jgi:phytol kinase
MTLKKELIRKSIHMSFIAIPIGYFFIEKPMVLLIVGITLGTALLVECARFVWPGFSRQFNRIPGVLLRTHEKSDITGATYLLMGSFISILFYEKAIAIAVLFIVILADAVSGLMGKFMGKKVIYHEKTLEGCLAFILISSIIVLAVPGVSILIGLVGVLSAFLVDLLIRKIDDNLTIPVIAGGFMQIIWLI